MTGEQNFGSATIEIPLAEASAGTTRQVHSPVAGTLTVQVPPGTVDGTVLWVDAPTGAVAVTIRVTQGFPSAPPVPGAFPPPPPAPGPYGAHPPQPGAYPAQPGPYAAQPGAYGPPPGPYGQQPGAYGPPPGAPGAPAGPYSAPPMMPMIGAPAQPKKGLGKGVKIAGIGLAAVLAVGCCGGVIRTVVSGDDDTGASGGSTSGGSAAKSTPTAAAALTPAQYAQALAASDQAIKAGFTKLRTGDNGAFAKAAPGAADSIRAEADKLRAAEPPAGAATIHANLASELDSLGDVIEETAGTKQACPAASPYDAVLTSGWADSVRDDAKRLAEADPDYKFGTFLPAAPKEQNRRLKTGVYVKARSTTSGLGQLKIKNGAEDTTISLVPTKSGSKAAFTVYVRGGGSYTVKGIKDGTYRVFTASGEDWNAGRKGFTRGCNFSKFDDTFKFETTATSSSIWTITLTPVIGGNASTSDVDPGGFPQ